MQGGRWLVRDMLEVKVHVRAMRFALRVHTQPAYHCYARLCGSDPAADQGAAPSARHQNPLLPLHARAHLQSFANATGRWGSCAATMFARFFFLLRLAAILGCWRPCCAVLYSHLRCVSGPWRWCTMARPTGLQKFPTLRSNLLAALSVGSTADRASGRAQARPAAGAGAGAGAGAEAGAAPET